MIESLTPSEVGSLIITAVQDLKDESEVTSSDPVTESTILFGREGIFDSLGLVSLIVDVEQRIEDRGISITLGDERAVSQRRSPFRTVQSLTDYVCQLVKEQGYV
jgi:acyl carrier protein